MTRSCGVKLRLDPPSICVYFLCRGVIGAAGTVTFIYGAKYLGLPGGELVTYIARKVGFDDITVTKQLKAGSDPGFVSVVWAWYTLGSRMEDHLMGTK